jgi:hypothetical protein
VKLPPALRYRDFRLFTIGYFPAETGEYVSLSKIGWCGTDALVAGSALLCGLISWRLPRMAVNHASL